MNKKFNNEVAENPELNERDELEEDEHEEAEEDGDPTLPWLIGQADQSDEIDDSESDILTGIIRTSDILKNNPNQLKISSTFEEITVNQNTTINGAKWHTKLLCIEKGCTLSVTHGGILYLLQENGSSIVIVGQNYNSFTATDEDIVMGKSKFFEM